MLSFLFLLVLSQEDVVSSKLNINGGLTTGNNDFETNFDGQWLFLDYFTNCP